MLQQHAPWLTWYALSRIDDPFANHIIEGETLLMRIHDCRLIGQHNSSSASLRTGYAFQAMVVDPWLGIARHKQLVTHEQVVVTPLGPLVLLLLPRRGHPQTPRSEDNKHKTIPYPGIGKKQTLQIHINLNIHFIRFMGSLGRTGVV